VAPPPPEVVEPYPVLPPDARVELVDVALAWPLPPGTGALEGWLGPVLECATVQVFEPLTRTDEPEDLCAALTVTAARLDPCFREGGPEAACRPQLRLVLQPVFDGVARDASLHVFYAVDEDVVVRAVARLMQLRLARSEDGRQALGLHPLLQDEAGRADVAAVVVDVLAAARLEQFTQITVHGGDAAWTFEFREFRDGAPTEGDARQQHLLSTTPDVIDMSVTPTSGSDDAFPVLLDDEAADLASIEEQQAAFDRAARVENPGIHDPGTIDCATCHVAAPARVAARARSPLVDGADTFTSLRHDLTPSPVFANPQFIHAFAWRGTSLAINQRVVNEAALSADVFEELLIARGVLPQ
jgi:hypothetical protein